MKRLFCTFVVKDKLEDFIQDLNKKYTLINNRIFILESNDKKEEYIITYNTEQGVLGDVPKNTILVHRNKDYNVLYTINALNSLIKSINNGYLDKSYKINWNQYKNSILLLSTQEPGYNKIDTKLFKIMTF